MRTLLAVFAALVVMLGIVSGTLWKDLRSARQLIAELQDPQSKANLSARSTPVQAPPLAIEAPPVPSAAVQLPDSQPLSPPLPPPAPLYPPVSPSLPVPRPAPVVVVVPAPERPLGLPTLTQPLVGTTAEERRVEALAQSDRTARARVTQWSTVLNLTPEQLQVLNDTAMAELRRETEDSLQIVNRTGTMDAQSAARLRVETVNRQYETLTRIVDGMTPHLAPEQSNRMRTMFQNWLTTNMARARAEQERANVGGY